MVNERGQPQDPFELASNGERDGGLHPPASCVPDPFELGSMVNEMAGYSHAPRVYQTPSSSPRW